MISPSTPETAAPLYDLDGDLQRYIVSTEGLADQRIFGFNSADSRGRPFKMLRTPIAKLVLEKGVRIIGITSAAPHVGKTFVTANLGAALSRIAELDVCLIDLDLHRPALGPRFGMEDMDGIHDYLTGDVSDIRTIAHRVNDERLVIIPGFRRDVATGELLTNARGEAMFAGMRAMPKSTVVLVDMPPIFADDDAQIIGAQLDGFLLIVEDGKSTKKQAEDTIRILQPTPLIGTVLNRYRYNLFNDEYGYGRSYGYGAYY
ncbi:Mrp family chromosome partitioning ATPase [Sphingomonas vulcanisoli]|uniref:Mrp family chromosome partitioning ATPase n=1 Tax=Sphingomonas vulcanisoli TaxID=1658060 RepID=A0ABX0TQJ6_9SPHN|nr:CpsD/CapB family tyrosine-protein kinase [Sphingomonas vulcanisoli]NIJ07801.1 Mrp family chromosome partitioning ATPase [Sphingomonas vulcanisoli]